MHVVHLACMWHACVTSPDLNPCPRVLSVDQCPTQTNTAGLPQRVGLPRRASPALPSVVRPMFTCCACCAMLCTQRIQYIQSAPGSQDMDGQLCCTQHAAQHRGRRLQSISGMVDTAPREAGPEWPFLVAALQAHSKLLHNAIDGDDDPGIIHALFKQITLLHRAAGCGPEDLSLVLYQYGTWVYAETEDLQQARDLVQDSLEVCSQPPPPCRRLS